MGGPSLAEVNFDLIKHLKVTSINDAYKEVDKCEVRDWVDLAYWKDKYWYESQLAYKRVPDLGPNRFFLTKFPNWKVTSCEEYLDDPDVKVLRKGRREYLERDPRFITHCNNAGAEALALNIMLGCDIVLLTGFDMKKVDGRDNYHGNHDRKISESIYEDYYMTPFRKLKKDADKLGVKIINCTIGSALDIFPIMTLEETLSAERSMCA